MSSDPVISLRDITKAYRIWRDPSARLKAPLLETLGQLIPPRLRPAWLRRRLDHTSARTTPYYRDFHALENISFDIFPGESVGIVGRNGSGKSTLLQIIVGTLRPTSGQVKVRGRIAALLELGSGFNPEFTGRENVFLNASILGLTRAETEARFDEIAEFADIGEFIDQPVKTYSSGMTVRLAFAVQAMVAPDILIIDEALSVGDEAFQRKCFTRIEQLKQKGTTLLFVSHDSQSQIKFCNKSILLDRGEILHQCTPRNIFKVYNRLLYDPSFDRKQIDCACQSNGAPEVSTATPTPPHINVDHYYYLPDFAQSALVMVETPLARPHSLNLETLDGSPCNHISSGAPAIIVVKIEIKQNCECINFGCSLRSINGYTLSGTHFLDAAHAARNNAQAGEIVTARFSLNTLLRPDTYFISASMTAMNYKKGAIEIVAQGNDWFGLKILDSASTSLMTRDCNLLSPIYDQ